MASIKSRVDIHLNMLQRPATFFTFTDIDAEHIALGLGEYENSECPLVRIHSECLTGDAFRSLHCDCGLQLQESLIEIEKEGGYLLYLRQEGRGIGLYNKLEAYRLQAQGMDTYSANEALGFLPDQRSYEDAAKMLSALGIKTVRMKTNNGDKVKQLNEFGILVREAVTTETYCNRHNKTYLRAKYDITNHRLDREFLYD